MAGVANLFLIEISFNPGGNYMFQVNDRNANGVVLVSLLLTLNIFYTLF